MSRTCESGRQIYLLFQLQGRLAASDVKLVDAGQIGRRQGVEILACAPQARGDRLSQIAATAVMHCHRIGHGSFASNRAPGVSVSMPMRVSCAPFQRQPSPVVGGKLTGSVI